MKKVLVTGATGFLGSSLVEKLLSLGVEVFAFSRSQPKNDKVIWLKGDLIRENLGLSSFPDEIDTFIHLAAIINLGDKREGEIQKTNIGGTIKCLKLCVEHNIRNFIFLSTAYTRGINAYERSKISCEHLIRGYSRELGTKATIFKPSIIIGSPENPGPNQSIIYIATTLLKIHTKAEKIRKRFERITGLPPIVFGFRIKGNPEATLNLIPVNLVTSKIIEFCDQEGTFYITNPEPPQLKNVAKEVSEAISLKVQVVENFKPTLVERILNREIKPFLPYLQGEPDFETIVDKNFRLPEGYIRDVIKSFIS